MAFGTVNVGQARSDDQSFLKQEQVGIPGGLATLDGDGKLTESQRPDFNAYTKAEIDEKIGDAVTAHNGSKAAHPYILSSIDAVKAAVEAIELKYGTDVKENAFTVSFGTLNDVNVTGVWNADQARIEF